MDKIKALQLARERELDLIEVSPNAKPPVAKIYSFSKFKYQQEKKKKVNKSKSPEMKEMWFKVVIEKGDRDHKLKKIREFLDKKHPVKITIKGRGRVTRERYDKLMKTILADLADVATSEGFAKFDGRSMNTIVRANKVIKVKEASNEKQTKDTQSNGKTL
jgi:translation initiation factor IF-3